MHYASKYIISRRCDEPMRRSKEQGYIRQGVHWKCTNQCKTCICSIYKTNNGVEHHNNLLTKQIEDWTI